jgi:dihydroorotate dehydrogenase
VARPPLKSRRNAREAGGLSGPPLFDRSTAMLARTRQIAGRDVVLVGVGGVDSAATAWSKIAAGADLVQLYTGLAYQGPSLPARILAGLLTRLEERQIRHIADIRDVETERWAATWPNFW